MDGWKLQKSVFQNKKLTLPSLVKADRAKEFWKLMTVKRRCYSSTLFSLFMNASQIQQEFWTYFLCFLSIKNQHSLCVIGWLLTSLSNCINNVQHLSWQYLQLLDRWVQMYLSSAIAKVSFLALDPLTSTSSDKHAFFSVSSRRVLIFPSVARWHKLP